MADKCKNCKQPVVADGDAWWHADADGDPIWDGSDTDCDDPAPRAVS